MEPHLATGFGDSIKRILKLFIEWCQNENQPWINLCLSLADTVGLQKTCDGYGFIKSTLTIGFDILLQFKKVVKNNKMSGRIVLCVARPIFDYMVESEYPSLLVLEKQLNCRIILESKSDLETTQFIVERG